MINDPYVPSIYNRGYWGEPDLANLSKDLFKKLLGLWRGMFGRCYDKTSGSYKYYGEKGVYICKRWFSLANFIADAQKLQNWDKKLENWYGYSLDKDFANNKGVKCYSPNVCQWSTIFEQNGKTSAVVKFTAIGPNGEKIKTKNINKFAKEHNLSKMAIQHCLSDRMKGHRGWTFKRN